MKFIYLFVEIFLDFFLCAVSYFIPKKKNLFVFSALQGDAYKCNPKYLFKYILNNEKSITCYWITNDKNLYLWLSKNKIPVSYSYSFKSLYLILRAEYLIHNSVPKGIFFHGFFSFLGRFKIIQLWHGTAFKKIGVLNAKSSGKALIFSSLYNLFKKKNYQKYYLITATSQMDKEIFEKSFINKNVKITGYARNDIFFEKSIREINYNKKLKLDNYNKVILYAPTFRDFNFVNPFSDNFWKKLNIYLKNNNAIFLVNKHPYDKDFEVPKSFENIMDVSSLVDDIQDLLVDVDLLITDYSSISADYSLTNNPIIFYVYDYKTYMNFSRSFNYDLYNILPGPFIYDENTLLELIINNSWTNNKNYINSYESFKNNFHKFQDGNSCKRILKAIKKR